MAEDNDHVDVLKFACGLSTCPVEFVRTVSVGCVRSDCYNPSQVKFDWLREHDVTARDVFNHFPSVRALNLSQPRLSNTDLESLSSSVRDNKLKNLELSVVDLRDRVRYLVGATEHPALESLSLKYCDLCRLDVQRLNEALRKNKLPRLKELDLSGNPVEGCLADLLGESSHPGFPTLESLSLARTNLNKDDVRCLNNAARNQRLPTLKKLNLENNPLRGCLSDLFGEEDDHSGFPYLEELDLQGTRLSADDVQRLGKAVNGGKLPELKRLWLTDNTLTGCLRHLFGGPDCQGFSGLEDLNLQNTALNQDDLQSLNKAELFPNLALLFLGHNRLTGCVKDLFRGPGFLNLSVLDLDETELNLEDVESLTAAVTAGKLPELSSIHLKRNPLRGLEEAVERCVAACRVHCKDIKRVFVQGCGLNPDLTLRCAEKFEGVQIRIEGDESEDCSSDDDDDVMSSDSSDDN